MTDHKYFVQPDDVESQVFDWDVLRELPEYEIVPPRKLPTSENVEGS